MLTANEFRTGAFSGPLEKLLELVQDRKLEITEINLAQVTDDFLAYIRALQGAEHELPPESRVPARLIADFIAVASRLILIKSKSLLPDLTLTAEEEADIHDLEDRLKLYQELKPALKALRELWQRGKGEYARPYFLELGFALDAARRGGEAAAFFYPGGNVDIPALTSALGKIFTVFENLEHESMTIKDTLVTMEEKITEILKRLTDRVTTSLNDLAKEKSRSEIIVIFLAILYLAREQRILLEQDNYFSDIIIQNHEPVP